MRAYFCDNNDYDPREPHEQLPLTPVTPEELRNLGVLYWRLDGDNYLAQLDKIAKDRKYKNRDELVCSKEGLGDLYEKKLKMFFEEHLHEDEEIRYIVDGSGYFDVRDLLDRWIRIAVSKGDLIVLPAGIYHRFTLDTNDYLKTIRLFKEEPKWIPINRPADDNKYRLAYLQSLRDSGLYK
ncbi:911_t:CDS:2 [Funneliformis geosporum]|uniref:Acireductone dioxygenase n=1 Tax=Funneliformis geosporum TaxID=1117311 RepID=A0A9W4WUA8_9GLOM|nr:911_t:CDS:2 [Funneliformis geosporum]CAI2172687.1 18539_t:CDS:2 [Funneliformis geosporum]